MEIYIGKQMEITPGVYFDKNGKLLNEKTYPCTVVYVNRKHRYFTVEFKFPSGSFRESFKFEERRDYP